MIDSAERKIMDMIEQGQLSAEEGLRLINAIGSNHQSEVQHDMSAEDLSGISVPDLPDREETTFHGMPEEEKRRMKSLKRWWLLPFGIGLLFTALGAIWMYMGYTEHGFGFGFWLAWLPFLIGVFIVAVSFQTNRSVWLHLRVKEGSGGKKSNIAISMPLPLILTKWVVSNFGDRIPGIKDQPVGDVSEILEGISPEDPIYVHVKEDDGEEVEVFIG